MQGRKGLPLNITGVKQAEESARIFADVRFDAVYSSPQPRAVQTAQIIARTKNIVTDGRLDVFDVGEADNLIIDENMPLLYGLVPDPSYYRGVESPDAFLKRVYSFMDELLGKYRGKDAKVLLAGHKCTTGAIECYFNGLPENGDFFALSVKNGKVKIYRNI
jgi:probable phosphoglycerate mutase